MEQMKFEKNYTGSLKALAAQKVVMDQGPEDTTCWTLACALDVELEYGLNRCYCNGMWRSTEQTHKHLVALWKLTHREK